MGYEVTWLDRYSKISVTRVGVPKGSAGFDSVLHEVVIQASSVSYTVYFDAGGTGSKLEGVTPGFLASKTDQFFKA
jgi:hypothetical protein